MSSNQLDLVPSEYQACFDEDSINLIFYSLHRQKEEELYEEAAEFFDIEPNYISERLDEIEEKGLIKYQEGYIISTKGLREIREFLNPEENPYKAEYLEDRPNWDRLIDRVRDDKNILRSLSKNGDFVEKQSAMLADTNLSPSKLSSRLKDLEERGKVERRDFGSSTGVKLAETGAEWKQPKGKQAAKERIIDALKARGGSIHGQIYLLEDLENFYKDISSLIDELEDDGRINRKGAPGRKNIVSLPESEVKREEVPDDDLEVLIDAVLKIDAKNLGLDYFSNYISHQYGAEFSNNDLERLSHTLKDEIESRGENVDFEQEFLFNRHSCMGLNLDNIRENYSEELLEIAESSEREQNDEEKIRNEESVEELKRIRRIKKRTRG